MIVSAARLHGRASSRRRVYPRVGRDDNESLRGLQSLRRGFLTAPTRTPSPPPRWGGEVGDGATAKSRGEGGLSASQSPSRVPLTRRASRVDLSPQAGRGDPSAFPYT